MIVKAILSHGIRNPEKAAIIRGDAVVTYGTLKGKIISAAHKLMTVGIKKGDRVIFSASKNPSFVYGYFGAHLIGAVAVSIDPHTPERRVRYIVDEVSPSAIFSVREYGIEGQKRFPVDDLDCPEENASNLDLPEIDSLADILFTTGTSGNPKGVMLSHRNISAAAANINTFIQNEYSDREVVPLPLSHSFGLGRLRCVMAKGGTIILSEGFTFPGKIFSEMVKWKATGMAFVPAGLAILFRLTGDEIGKFSGQLRYIEIGSASMPPAHKERLMRLLPRTRICMHYGLTEASRSTFIEFHRDREALNSIGKPSPNVEVRIVDEGGNELPPGGKGKIVVKGGMVMEGYWNRERETEKVLREGWLVTGDIGYKDERGFIFLDGREGDIINVGGLKVSPVEVENVLSLHEKVESCACVGIPDPNGITGEAVMAFLVPENSSLPLPGKRELNDFLKGKLEAHMIPVMYRWEKTLPRTSSGKLQRPKLKERAEALLTGNHSE